MAKTKHEQESIINRKQYDAIKKMDRSEVDTFIRDFYQKGYEKGCEEATAQDNQMAHFLKFNEALMKQLDATKGMGKSTIAKIKAVLDKMEW